MHIQAFMLGHQTGACGQMSFFNLSRDKPLLLLHSMSVVDYSKITS